MKIVQKILEFPIPLLISYINMVYLSQWISINILLLSKVNTLFRVPSSFYLFFSLSWNPIHNTITFSPHVSLNSSRVWPFLKVSMLLMTSGDLNISLFSHSSGGRSPQSRCQRSEALCEGCREELPSLLWLPTVAAHLGFPWLVYTAASVWLCLYMTSAWCVSEPKFPAFHRDTSQWSSFVFTSNPVWPHGNLVYQPYLNEGFTAKLNWFSHYGEQYRDFLKNWK